MQSYLYGPFGDVTQSTGESNPFQFAGRENDGTGLYYNRKRYYVPEWGRFLSEDPIGFAGGLNRYIYAGNNPLKWVDYNGTAGELPGWARGVIIGTWSAAGGIVGMMGGASGGAALGLAGGPFAPVTSSAGAVGGGLAGAVKGAAVGAAIGAVAVGLIEGLSDLSDSIMEARRHGGAGGGGDTRTADEIIAQDKKGSIRTRFPGEMLNKTMAEIRKLAEAGDKHAQSALKLLTQRYYNK